MICLFLIYSLENSSFCMDFHQFMSLFCWVDCASQSPSSIFSHYSRLVFKSNSRPWSLPLVFSPSPLTGHFVSLLYVSTSHVLFFIQVHTCSRPCSVGLVTTHIVKIFSCSTCAYCCLQTGWFAKNSGSHQPLNKPYSTPISLLVVASIPPSVPMSALT